MEIYFIIVFFILGTIFGSFFNVIGTRLPINESITKPRSHCVKCKHTLTFFELFPVLSYIFQRGKCKNCKEKIPIFHPIYEILCGISFSLAYIVFGFTIDLIIPITLISMLLIIIVSDYLYMIILDEVLIVFGVALVIQIFILQGFTALMLAILNGLIAFGIMFLIKIIGDKLFKRESMGGGDIKLLFFFGLCLGWDMAILSIFFGSILGFPVSLIVLKIKKDNIIPFGPFLSVGAMIILLLGLNSDMLFNIFM